MTDKMMKEKINFLQSKLHEEYKKFNDKVLLMYESVRGCNSRDYFEAKRQLDERVKRVINTFILVHGMSCQTCVYILTKVEHECSPLTKMKQYNMKSFASNNSEKESQ